MMSDDDILKLLRQKEKMKLNPFPSKIISEEDKDQLVKKYLDSKKPKVVNVKQEPESDFVDNGVAAPLDPRLQRGNRSYMQKKPSDIGSSSPNSYGMVRSVNPPLHSFKIPKFEKKPQPSPSPSFIGASAAALDDWGDPIASTNVDTPTPSTSVKSLRAEEITKHATKVVEVDEWGDPIIKKTAEPATTVAIQRSIEETEVDDWGDPIKKTVAPASTVTLIGPLLVEARIDDWGKPKNTITFAPLSPGVATKLSTAETELDDWGDPIKKTSATGTGSRGNVSEPADDWGPPAASTTAVGPPVTNSVDDWGPPATIGNGFASNVDSERSREGGRGGFRGGRGRGGGRAGGSGDRDRTGEWPCTSCDFKCNYATRTSCFRCKAPNPNPPSSNIRTPYQKRPGRENNPNYEPIANKRFRNDDWGEKLQSPAANFDDWSQTPTTPTSTPQTPVKLDDWSSVATPITPVHVKPSPTAAISQPSSVNIDWDYSPLSSGTSAPVVKAGRQSEKQLAEWICSDTRCGSNNFDWRSDCLRCGALKGQKCVNESRPMLRQNKFPRYRSTDEYEDRDRAGNGRQQDRFEKMFGSLSPEEPDRIKAPPCDQDLNRTVSIFSTTKSTTSAETQTPENCGWSHTAKNGNNMCFYVPYSLIPLSDRFEAVAQQAAGGSANIPSKFVIGPSKKSPIKPSKDRRVVKVSQDVTVEVPKTRSKINATWNQILITIERELEVDSDTKDVVNELISSVALIE